MTRKISVPTPEEIRVARGDMSQTEAAALLGKGLKTWQNWEAPIASPSHRSMDPIYFEMFLIKKNLVTYSTLGKTMIQGTLHMFDTREDAIKAGYVLFGTHHAKYREFTILSRRSTSSTSPAGIYLKNPFYADGLVDPNFIAKYVSIRAFCEPVTAYLTKDLNAIHQPGVMCSMYPPDRYATAIIAAKKWIDDAYNEHPELLAAEKRLLQDREESDARQRVKNEAYKLKQPALRAAWLEQNAATD